jgi:hypothetical protein
MGLDWIVGAKPRDPAHYEVLRRSLANPADEALVRAWHEVSKIDSWDTLEAPRVGSSTEADEWFKEHRLSGVSPAEVAEWLERNRGVAVVALVACDGVPTYSNAPMNRDLEFSSFRGAFLADAVPVIGEAMFQRAHQNMLPGELLAFGDELQAIGQRYAREHGVEAIAERRDFPPDDAEGPANIAHIIVSAARWCLFWSRRGHWLNTWW